jgi:hypothetical protein
VRICHPLKFLRSREPARPERKPGKKGDPVPLAALHDVVGASVANAVAILDRDDVGYRARPLEFGDAHIRDADHPNLSLSLEVDDGPERLLDADTRVNRVQLVEIDHLAPQHLEAALAMAPDRLRSAVRPAATQAALRGHDQPIGIRVERLGDQPLAP